MKIIFAICALLFKTLKNGATGIWALITAFIDYITYAIFVKALGFSVVVSNVFSWGIAESFAFFSNKFFKYKSTSNRLLLKEYVKFFLAKVFILVIETVFLKITIEILGFEELKMKILALLIVLIINLPINRYMVFNKSEYKSLKQFLKNIKKNKNSK